MPGMRKRPRISYQMTILSVWVTLAAINFAFYPNPQAHVNANHCKPQHGNIWTCNGWVDYGIKVCRLHYRLNVHTLSGGVNETCKPNSARKSGLMN